MVVVALWWVLVVDVTAKVTSSRSGSSCGIVDLLIGGRGFYGTCQPEM